MMHLKKTCVALSFCLTRILFAHPVSFEGSVPVTTLNEARKTEFIASYSIKHWWGVGAHYFRIKDKVGQSQAVFAKSNFLLKRWNGKGSQANIYVWGGLGSLWTEKTQSMASLYGIRADYETRKLFLESNYRRITGFSNQDYDFYQAQVGLAPYLAGYQDLQSWFMVRANYTPQLELEFAITPMLRFFYKNVFWELGANQKGHIMVNTMVHF